jgi:hypothetical protein
VSVKSSLPPRHTIPTFDVARARSEASRSELAAIVVPFSSVTCLFTAPQVFRLGSHVGPHCDALFGVWRLAWMAHQLPNDPAHLFDANTFHPEVRTLAFSDAIPLLGIAAAPAIWLGVPPVVAYNLLVLLSFPASGIAMYLLSLFTHTVSLTSRRSSCCGPACWIPLACLAVLAAHGVRALLLERGRGRLALAAVVAAAVIIEGLAIPLPLNPLPRGP